MPAMRQHGRHRDGDAEQARERVGHDDARDDHDGRQRRRFERNGETLDHVGAVARHRGLRDGPHGTEADAGIVLGDHHDEGRDGETDDGAPEQVLARELQRRRPVRSRSSAT